jgi:hypothetical protein
MDGMRARSAGVVAIPGAIPVWGSGLDIELQLDSLAIANSKQRLERTS